MAQLDVHLRLSPGLIRLALPALMLGLAASELASENVTLTTYYPAPSGVYTKMITTGDTTLARDGGNVGVGTAASASYKLNVNGSANVIGNANVTGTASAGVFSGSSYVAGNAVYGNFIQSNGGINANGTLWDINGNVYASNYYIGALGKWASQLGTVNTRWWSSANWIGMTPGVRQCANGQVVTGMGCWWVANQIQCNVICSVVASQ